MTELDTTGIRHLPDCPEERRRYKTSPGRTDGAEKITCRTCGRFTVVFTGPAEVSGSRTPAPEPITDHAPNPAVIRYYCREHSRPVSWHGRDCRECRREADQRAAEQAERRAWKAEKRAHRAELAKSGRR